MKQLCNRIGLFVALVIVASVPTGVGRAAAPVLAAVPIAAEEMGDLRADARSAALQAALVNAVPIETRVAEAVVATHPSRGDSRTVEGASAHLVTSASGATVDLFARDLVPGNVYTLWWIVIDEPYICESSPCKPSDILGRTEVVDAEVAYGDGAVADADGVVNLFAHFAPGDVPGGWYGNPYENLRGAEIHLVLNDHGPAIAGMEEEMRTTYRAGCTDESLPAAFPPTAKADGTPGPNACQLYQVAIFRP